MKTNSMVLASLIILAGCTRGESKSLDEIFQIAKANFSAASRQGVPAEVVTSLETAQKDLEALISGSNQAELQSSINQLSESLSALLPKSGYTVRPALTELRNQYIELSRSDSVTADELKLLASRTYSTLSEELAATRFSVK